ncbi:uncharacterized protein LOC110445161 [Mizuhopecten yessoensis]|uniref:uncharacterized protein LOC110445161 n=1 Tax=Mizuhopecten yessoensis TaxID=6573 RepID=UPI000B4583A1|nr:uncharacterized protein LOC110445161 [Mizuhopecten yessoensis]
MSRGDCCPDVYFAVPPMTCINTTLLNTTGSSTNLKPKPPSYEIVNSCPSETGSRERNLCEKSYTPKELLTRPPVASATFPVSYKNKYCAMCNGENDTLNWILDIDCLKFADFNFLSTYQDIIDLARNRKCRMRNIKEIYPTDKIQNIATEEYDESVPEVAGERCSKHQIYDYRKDECRNTTCFPGKVLNDSSCIPLLTITNNLRYTISIEFTGQLPENQTNALDFLKAMEIGINLHISKLFGTTEFKSDNFHLLSNFPCESKSAYVNTETIKLYLYMTVHIEGYVPRFLTENSLLENTSDMWNVSVDSEVIGLVAKTSLRAVMTPTIIDKASFKETCFIQRFSNHTFVPWQTFRSVYVSKVLLCRQIELESDEYDINIAKMELKIHSIEKTLPFDKFQRSSNGRVRVCIEDIEAISDPVKEYVDPSLSILTLVCNTASMICLFLTFAVYLMHPTLQSIPGINNMCLVFTLFLTQLSFQFGSLFSVDSVLCEVIGIVLHVLWLSLFGCMNICSFHMFRVFSGIGKYHAAHNKLKTLKNYVTYSFGLPVVIVFVNTAFTLGFNEGQKTGYGVDKCFITSKISFFVTFLFPIIAVCLSNIAFFSITAHKIRNTPRVKSNQENHRHFGIYVKLFFITGVTWLTTVIEAFFPLSIVSYFTTILNGCQGVFIFLSFIVNRRVFMLLKEGYENASRKFSRSSSAPATQTSSVALHSSSTDKGLNSSSTGGLNTSSTGGLNTSSTNKGLNSSSTGGLNTSSTNKGLNSSSTDKGLNSPSTDKGLNSSSTGKGLNSSSTGGLNTSSTNKGLNSSSTGGLNTSSTNKGHNSSSTGGLNTSSTNKGLDSFSTGGLNTSSTNKGLNSSSTDKDLNSSSTGKGLNSFSTDKDLNSSSTDIDRNSSSTDKDLNSPSTDMGFNSSSTDI